MGTYTQLTRNADGEYISEIKKVSETFYVVEYATIATYYKVDAATYEEAEDKVYEDRMEGIESPDRHEVELQETDKGMYIYQEEKHNLRGVLYSKPRRVPYFTP
jgi:hypothetical protein|tara:strand:- start:899 stop:1210 length:312 start_codon:yes stop_codon:yes gene_type:complete